MLKSSQIAVCGASPTPSPRFQIEIDENIFKKLSTIAHREHISVNELASALLKCILLLHRTETQRIIDQIKRNHH